MTDSRQPPHAAPDTPAAAAAAGRLPLGRRVGRAVYDALAAAQARFARARAGSVLILVVALLVLIALAGTALITTARTDRYSAAQNTANVQIEMLVDAVVRLSKGALVEDLFGAGDKYRPAPAEPQIPWQATPPGEYDHYDHPRNDSWLASRIPSGTAAQPYWLYISAPMVSGQAFESPAGGLFTARTQVQPTFLRVGGETHPALRVLGGGPAGPFIAADADGDGIADAGLWRIPVGTLNGVTYYAGVRIIDNAAAFNANVHWKTNAEEIAAPALPGDLFTVNVHYQGALLDGAGGFMAQDQMNRLNAYRAGQPQSIYLGAASPAAVVQPVPASEQPIDDTGTARADFLWISRYDQWYHQLARRLDSPGYAEAGRRFRALTSEDATSLAYRFVLRNPNAPLASPLEQMLWPSLELPRDPARATGTARAPRNRTQPYPAPNASGNGPVSTWFTENFDTLGTARTFARRPLTVTRNPMANDAPMHDMSVLPGTVVSENDQTRMPPRNNAAHTPRTSINTAPFGELWRAFWMVMNGGGGAVPTDAAAIFRNPLRRPQRADTLIDGKNMLLLRSALAAVNAEDLRDSDTYEGGGDQTNQNVTSRKIFITAKINGADTPVEVTVFGNEAQPFITEVYANNDSSEKPRPRDPNAPPPAPEEPEFIQNPKGYVSVELYNPTNVPINLRGWRLGVLRRWITAGAPNSPYPAMLVKPLTGFRSFSADGPTPIIQPGERLVLENYNGGAVADSAAQWRPPAAPVTGPTKYVKNLHEVLKDGATIAESGELVLLRPRAGDGGTSQEWQEANGVGGPNETVNLDEFVPLDSFDFTGFEQAAPTAQQYREMHYVRTNEGAAEKRWKCVYPGAWKEAGTGFRHDGIRQETFAPQPTGQSAWNGNDGQRAIAMGAADEEGTYVNPYPGIQLNNKDFAGPNPIRQTGNRFPFGQFARNGDILQTPFIGAYTIRTTANADVQRGESSGRSLVLEMNPVTHDSARAIDNETDTNGESYATTNQFTFDDEYEQIGRFTPLSTLTAQYDRTATPPRPTEDRPDPYAWARDLFDFLTVDAPAAESGRSGSASGDRDADYLPNVRPANYGTFRAGSERIDRLANEPDEVEGNDAANSIDGKVNINTAPARVIAALMMAPTGSDAGGSNGTFANGVDDGNEYLANMIVRWRDGDPAAGLQPRGPFYSIHDLNRVWDLDDATANTRFQSGGRPGNAFDQSGAQPGTSDGDYSPRDASDEVTNDFEARYLVFNRISNMVSTRSDSYTVYIVVQGWRGVGTPNPSLVVQRRSAFLADRSGVNQNRKDFTPVVIPTN